MRVRYKKCHRMILFKNDLRRYYFHSHLKRLHMKADSSKKLAEELDSRKFGVSSTTFFSMTDFKIFLIGLPYNVIEF